MQTSNLHIVTLEGIQRVQLPSPLPNLSPNHIVSPAHAVTYSNPEVVPTAQTIAKFRSTSLKLLSRLNQTSQEKAGAQQKSLTGLIIKLADGATPFAKLARVVQDADDERLPWIADLVVGVLGTDLDFNDKAEYLTKADPEGT